MTPEEIIEKAKKAKRTEKKIAPIFIVLGALFLAFFLYFTYDLKIFFSFYADLYNSKMICSGTEEEAQEYIKSVIMLTGLFSLIVCLAFHKAVTMIIDGIGYLKGNKERDLLITLYEEKNINT